RGRVPTLDSTAAVLREIRKKCTGDQPRIGRRGRDQQRTGGRAGVRAENVLGEVLGDEGRASPTRKPNARCLHAAGVGPTAKSGSARGLRLREGAAIAQGTSQDAEAGNHKKRRHTPTYHDTPPYTKDEHRSKRAVSANPSWRTKRGRSRTADGSGSSEGAEGLEQLLGRSK